MAFLFYVFAGIFALAALWELRRPSHVRNQIMSFAFLTAAIGLSGYQLLIEGLFLRSPHLFMVMNIFGIIAITSLYYYSCWLVDSAFTLTGQRVLTLLAIASLYFVLLIPFWYVRSDIKVQIIGEILTLKILYTRHDPKLFGISVFKLSNGYFAFACILTFALSLRLILPRVRWGEAPKQAEFYAALCYATCFVTAILGTIAAIFNLFSLLVISGITLAVAIGGLYLAGRLSEKRIGLRNRSATP